MQAIADLAPKPLDECRVLDLARLDGRYAIECALRARACSGIEAREASLAKANFAKDALGLSRLEFVRDDVWNLSVERYGEFDVIICSGILYHLDTPDVFHLIERTYEMARRLVVLDTHVTSSRTSTVDSEAAATTASVCRRGTARLTAQLQVARAPVDEELWAGSATTRASLLAAVAAERARGGRLLVRDESLNPPTRWGLEQ